MKKLSVLTQGIRGGVLKTTVVGRGKLIIESSEDRPSYIEIDNYEGNEDTYKQREEPEIRISFGDNTNWKGSIDKLNNDLKLVKLSKLLLIAVKTGGDSDSIIEQMLNLQ